MKQRQGGLRLVGHTTLLRLLQVVPKTTLSDTFRPKRLSEGSFALSSNCLGFEAGLSHWSRGNSSAFRTGAREAAGVRPPRACSGRVPVYKRDGSSPS
jgi:hypothetical protein